MNAKAKWSPTGRGVKDVAERVARLEAYERWREPTSVDFQTLVGVDEWERYWSLVEAVIAEMRDCQTVADALREVIVGKLKHIPTEFPGGDTV
jgi:hypothetical protein